MHQMYFFSWLLLRKISTEFLPLCLTSSSTHAWRQPGSSTSFLLDGFFQSVDYENTTTALISPGILLPLCPLPFHTVHLFFFPLDRSLYQPAGSEKHLLSLKEPTQMSITLYPFYLMAHPSNVFRNCPGLENTFSYPTAPF